MPQQLATAQQSFSGPDARRLILRVLPSISFSTDILIACYPPNPDKIASYYGSFVGEGERTDSYRQTLNFDLADTGQLNFPNPSNLIYSTIDAAFDADLNLITPQFRYNSNTDSIESVDASNIPRVILGGVVVDYTTTFSRHRLVRNNRTILPGGSLDVVAVKNGVSTRLEIDFNGAVAHNDLAEVYRVYSEVVLDPGGRWEKPPNFPTDNAYPITTTAQPDNTNYAIDDRAHEIGYIDSLGRSFVDRFYVRNEQPYTSAGSYKPAYVWRQNTTAPDAKFNAVWSRVDFARAKADAKARYPGLT